MGFRIIPNISLLNLKQDIWWKKKIYVRQWLYKNLILHLKIKNKLLLGNLLVKINILSKNGFIPCRCYIITITSKK